MSILDEPFPFIRGPGYYNIDAHTHSTKRKSAKYNDGSLTPLSPLLTDGDNDLSTMYLCLAHQGSITHIIYSECHHPEVEGLC